MAPEYRLPSLTWSLGNPVDQSQAEDKKTHAELEQNASHVAAKAGPLNLSSSGAVTVDNKDRRDGKADQIIGSGKEFVGNAIGSDSLRREGRDQNTEGQGREAAGQLKDFTSGVGKPYKYTILHHRGVLPCTECANYRWSQQSYRHRWGRCFWSDWQYPGTRLVSNILRTILF